MNREVDRLAKTFSIPEDKAFIVWFGMIAFNLSEDESHDAMSIEGPNDKGIDLFWVDDAKRTVYICQCKYSSEGKSKPKINDLSALLGSTDWLLQSSERLIAEGRSELIGTSEEFQEAIKNQYTVQLWFVYAGKKSQEIDKRVRVFNAVPENEDKRWTAVNCSDDLLDILFQEVQGNSKRIESATISFSIQPFKDISFEFGGDFGKGLVATVDGQQLAKLYELYGDTLFARNIRGFLGERTGTVNSLIKNTIIDKRSKGNFWAFNNGITIVCEDYDYRPRKKELHIRNFSIVNGGQTTVIMARHKDAYKEGDVSVLVRIIKPPQTIIEDITRYTNSQNQIRVWDFSSQDPIQIKLKQNFSDLDVPYYYDIRRGEWASYKSQQREKYRTNRSPYRRIKHELLAQYLAAFSGNAVIAYKNKGFLAEKFKGETFPPDLRVEEALFIWFAGEKVKELIHEETRVEREKVEQGDKEREKFVYFLVRGGKFYSLATFGLLAQLRNGHDYLRSIDQERIISKKADKRIEKYAKLSIQHFKRAANDELKIRGTELSVLVKDLSFFDGISERVKSYYEEMKVASEFFEEALPKLF
jgi:hypothetical protein